MSKQQRPPKPPTARDVLALFGNMTEAAKVLGLQYKAVSKMAERDRIAIEHWPTVIAAARERGVTLTDEDMRRMWVRSKEARPRPRQRGERPRAVA